MVARFVVIDIPVMMPVFAMHMFMRDFFFGRSAHFRDIQCEAQCHTGQRMIPVQHDLVIGDIGHGKDQ